MGRRLNYNAQKFGKIYLMGTPPPHNKKVPIWVSIFQKCPSYELLSDPILKMKNKKHIRRRSDLILIGPAQEYLISDWSYFVNTITDWWNIKLSPSSAMTKCSEMPIAPPPLPIFNVNMPTITLLRCLSKGVFCHQYVLKFKNAWIWPERRGQHFGKILKFKNVWNIRWRV